MSPNGNIQSAMRLAAAESIGERLENVRARIGGVLDNTDIEQVHQMRVASRRLRVALKLFSPGLPGKQAARWTKSMRRVTRSLGPARDLDVQTQFVQSYRDAHPDPKLARGLDRLILRLQQRRDRQQRRVSRAMDRISDSGVLDEMSRFSRELVARAQLDPVPPSPALLGEHAADAILGYLQALLAYEPFVEMPDRAEELHAMRIAAKRLRYALEVFVPIYAGSIKPFVKSVRRIQTQLGDLHDCDVWIEALPKFLDDERARMTAYQGHARGFNRLTDGVEHLLADRARRRQEVHEEFVAAWRHLRKQQTWRNLMLMVNAQSTSAGPADSAAADGARAATLARIGSQSPSVTISPPPPPDPAP